MRCKGCDYPLWNLRSRECPECGKPFLPSEFDYVLNSVRFCCPACGQAYYGTGERGRLVPPAFLCVSCGAACEMDSMVLLPTEGVREEQTKPETMPWLERRSLGTLRAWFAMLGRAMVAPHRLMDATPEGAPAGIVFATVTNLIFVGLGLGPIFLLPLGIGFAVGGRGGAGIAGMAGGLAIAFAIALGVVLASMGLWIVVTHTALRMSGELPFPLRRTAQAIGYSAGANALLAIPCLGMYSVGLWWMISATIMVAKGQRVSGVRAACCTFLLPALTVVGLLAFGIYQASTAGTGGAAAGGPTVVWPSTSGGPEDPQGATLRVLQAVMRHSIEHGGRGPDHALTLVTGNPLTPGDLTVRGPGETTEPPASALGITLDDYALLGDASRGEFNALALDRLPAGIVAHRVGDFVFTYHGVALSSPEMGRAWVVVYARGPGRLSDNTAVIGYADGTIERVSADALGQPLTEHNAWRAENKLPPLPDPFGVTTESPAPGGP